MHLRIELPLPPKELSPNGGKKWNVHKINRITHEAQEHAIAAVREQIPFGKPLEQAKVTIVFVVPTKGRYDLDNFIAAAKPYQDGLVKASVITDDCYQVMKPTYDVEYQRGVRRTVITVEGA